MARTRSRKKTTQKAPKGRREPKQARARALVDAVAAQGVEGDQVGVVLFHGAAQTWLPLTDLERERVAIDAAIDGVHICQLGSLSIGQQYDDPTTQFGIQHALGTDSYIWAANDNGDGDVTNDSGYRMFHDDAPGISGCAEGGGNTNQGAGLEAAIDLLVDDATLEARRKALAARPPRRLAGAHEKYAAQVKSAYYGAVTHSGAVDWPMDGLDNE